MVFKNSQNTLFINMNVSGFNLTYVNRENDSSSQFMIEHGLYFYNLQRFNKNLHNVFFVDFLNYSRDEENLYFNKEKVSRVKNYTWLKESTLVKILFRKKGLEVYDEARSLAKSSDGTLILTLADCFKKPSIRVIIPNYNDEIVRDVLANRHIKKLNGLDERINEYFIRVNGCYSCMWFG